jgi:hypothetical protein
MTFIGIVQALSHIINICEKLSKLRRNPININL